MMLVCWVFIWRFSSLLLGSIHTEVRGRERGRGERGREGGRKRREGKEGGRERNSTQFPAFIINSSPFLETL